MKYSMIAAALAAPVVLAAPAKRQSTNIDTTVLQFALTLEHLENVFYKQALQKFSQADFAKAGYGANYYNNLKFIAYDEQSHVQFLTSALQAANTKPNAACTYSFPYTDVQSFITLSSIIEGVGTSAYLGGAPLITSKDYLTAAGSILVTEALHTSLQRSAVNEVPAADPYGTPLDPTSVYTIAAAFIKECPAGNAALPFTPYPSLTLNTMAPGTAEGPDLSPAVFEKRGNPWESYSPPAATTSAAPAPVYTKSATPAPAPAPTTSAAPSYSGPPASSKNKPALMVGASVSFSTTSHIPAGSFLTFVSGLKVVSVAANINDKTATVAIPAAAQGQTYVFLTKSAAAGNKLDGASIIAGPAILEVTPVQPSIDYSQY